jgi:hydrophobic/amphiphilic exporter-1 (mainly G- bacteria), HAE1 family
MQWLAQVCVRRPVLATVIVLSLVVIGFFGYTKLGVDLFPKVDFPIVTITLQEDGASPEEIETDVVDKVEEAVNTIAGIDQLNSTSYEAFGVIGVTFVLEKDIDVAVQEVRDKVSGVLSQLPTDMRAPVVDKIDPDASPILQIALSSPGNIRETTEYADKVLRRQLENITGVGQVTIVGGQKRQINIDIDPVKLQAYGMTAIDVQNALRNQNIQVPGGDVDQRSRKLTLRTQGRVLSSAEFANIVVGKRESTPVRISDIGVVDDGVEEAKTVADLDGVPTVLLSIRKQSGLNTVATVEGVKSRLQEIKKALPHGYSIRITNDQSVFIKASTDAVQEHLKVGSVLAALVVLLFLWNLRTTIISAIAIPASIIATFALMYFMSFTLNSLTLLALTLSVGIVIDDAIVVLENIYRFIEEKGMRPFEAAIEGTKEIGMAVMATTFSLIAVFLPVAFMQGIVGRFMNSFGLTMAFAIFISLIISFTLTPMMASRWIKPSSKAAGVAALPENIESDSNPVGIHEQEQNRHSAAGHSADSHGGSKESGIFKPIDIAYTWLLVWSMKHRWVIVLLCFAALFSTGQIASRVSKNFLPQDDQSQYQIIVRAPEGDSLESTKAQADRIAADVRALPAVEYTVVTIGDNTQQTQNLATVFVKMKDVEQRINGYSQQDLMQMTRTQVLPKYGRLRSNVAPVAAISTGQAPADVSYFISGPDLKELSKYSQAILSEFSKVPGVVDADSSLIVGKPEMDMKIDRERAADLGVDVASIATTAQLLVGGLKVTDYYENGEQYEVHLRAPLTSRNDWGVIRQINVPSTTPGALVKLEDVTQMRHGDGPSQITRQDRRRNVLITCNVLPTASQKDVSAALEQIIQKQNMPATYRSGPAGTSRELVKAFLAFATAFLLAIIFMYLILAAQFESWVHPITILIALPLTVPFALLSILIFHQSLNIFTVLGMLVLFGVVKKNGILQVDHTNQLRARGMSRYDAIIQANRDRLRPILMTTIAFVAGMVPLVISKGTGAATNRGIGFTVLGGQSLSLLLTLLATPVFYSLFDDITVIRDKVKNRLFNRGKSTGA